MRNHTLIYNSRKIMLMAVLVIVCLTISSCGSKKSSDNKGKQGNQQTSQMALKTLKNIEKMNEKIIQLLDGPAVTEESSGQGQQPKQGQQSEQPQESQGSQSQSPQESQGSQSQSPQESQGSQQSQQPQESQGSQQSQQPQESQGSQQSQQPKESQGSQQSQPPKESQGTEQSPNPLQNPGAMMGKQIDEKKWKEVDTSIVELHTLFNDYMPSVLQMSADPNLNNGATNSLNQLTKNAQNRDYMGVLNETNALYKYICSFYALHQDKSAPVKLDQYYARSIMLAGMVADWNAAGASLKELKTTWQAQKPTLGENEKDKISKLDFSIAEIEKVIADKNQGLVQIKGKILMKNISELEKSLSKQ